MLLVGYSVTLGVIVGFIAYVNQSQIIEYVRASSEIEAVQATTTAVEVEREVRIKVVYNWTHDRIKQEIEAVFPDAPIMYHVMMCESGGKIDAYNPTNNSHDNGLFQISDLHHGERVRALGLDVGNPKDNITFARILYDESGLQPWIWSKPCWSKYL